MKYPIVLIAVILGATVIASDAIRAADPDGIKAAITQQVNEVNKKNRDRVDSRIELVTVVAAPAQLKLMKVKTPRGIKFLAGRVISPACPPDAEAGTPCKQRFSIALDANKA